MSEAVQGALIVITGTIIGASITAIIAHITAQSQLKLRIYELKSDRLIKAREGVIIPLRKALTLWMEYTNQEMVILGQIREATQRRNKTKLSDIVKQWSEIAKKRDEARSTLRVIINQISDSQLLENIKGIEGTLVDTNAKIIEITSRANKPENFNSDAIEKLNKEFQKTRDTLIYKMMPLNRRIEELLSGEPNK